MNINLIYPSKYVKAADLGDKHVTVTIKSAVMEELGYGAEKERKLVIYFERATKGLILNRTNAMIIASMYTPETDNWLGSAIILYSLRVKAFGSWHDAVRVKEQVPPRNVGAAKMPEAMQEAPPIDDEDDVLDVDEGDEQRQDAPQPTQTPTTPSGSKKAHNPTSRTVDATTGEIADLDGDVIFGISTPDYALEWQALTGKEYDLVKWVSTLHKKSDGPCTLPQYQFLTGILDKLTKRNHRYALSLLCQSVVTKDNLPGRKVADNLLDLLAETIKEDGEDEAKPNPNYRPDMAKLITAIATVSKQQQELVAA